MKIKTVIACLLTVSICLLMSCSSKNEQQDRNAIEALAQKHVAGLEVTQLLEELLLSVDNDTISVCYSLVMPKQSLLRLMNKETYPTEGGLEKIQQCLVNRYSRGIEYIDSCVNDKKDDKDWLINNTINEPVNPIWEQIAHE